MNKFEFVVNKTVWDVKLISNEEMQKIVNDTNDEYFTHGYTSYKENIIYINNTTPEEVRTLIHELTHCWLYVYGHNQDNKQFSNEDVCEIVASISPFIKDVVLKFERWLDSEEEQNDSK